MNTVVDYRTDRMPCGALVTGWRHHHAGGEPLARIAFVSLKLNRISDLVLSIESARAA